MPLYDKIPVYFVPGLGASSKIFENIKLPENQYAVHYLDWIPPKDKKESIQNYARRMCAAVKEANPVLVGVSFGGLMVQEMSKIIPVKKTIIISSIKSRNELPRSLKWASATCAYKILPYKKMMNVDNLAKFAFGKSAKKRINLYRKYIYISSENYLPWAFGQMLNWNPENNNNIETIHIHGDKDHIFPIKNITNCEVIAGGTHTMILIKSKPIAKLLTQFIDN
ncbi:MAG: alpha/beta hydrolase [Flavobacteriales bacterium]|nr:MAG: alpha/beta hydrolase [Flavobacteriales bacterium]